MFLLCLPHQQPDTITKTTVQPGTNVDVLPAIDGLRMRISSCGLPMLALFGAEILARLIVFLIAWKHTRTIDNQ